MNLPVLPVESARHAQSAIRAAVALGLAAVLSAVVTRAVAQEPAPALSGTGAGIRWEKTVPVIAEGPWSGPRTPDGQPDISGHWSNTIANHNDFEDPQGGSPGERRPASEPRAGRAPSRVSDPADGRIPYQPWARAAQQEFAAHFTTAEEQRFIEPLNRCAPAGVPKSFYWHGYEISQYPGIVLFRFNSGTRVVYLDGRPHLPADVKLWNADSRGRWEGNTLVVDVRNNNAKALFGRHGNFSSDKVVIEERYVFAPDGKRYNYVATFTDPDVYTRPWKATIPARRYTEADVAGNGWHYETNVAKHAGRDVIHERDERICVENNGPFGGGAVGVPDSHVVITR